jgi:hypothetical protein
MDSIMKSEIFFVIASVGVIIITIGTSIALFYIIRVLKTVDEVSDDVKEHIAAFGSWVRGNALTKRFFAGARKPRKKRASGTAEE